MEETYVPPAEPIRLEKWSTIYTDPDPYKPPELRVMRLRGEAHGHPRHDNGRLVTTTRVVDLDLEARRARTRSGSVYALGEPEEGFVDYLRETGRQDLLAKLGM